MLPRTQFRLALILLLAFLCAAEVHARSFLRQDKERKAPEALPRAEAESFARLVMEAIDIIKEDLEDVEAGQMATWAIQELYGYAREKVPENIAKQMRNAPKMKARQLELLLADARMEVLECADSSAFLFLLWSYLNPQWRVPLQQGTRVEQVLFYLKRRCCARVHTGASDPLRSARSGV